MQRGNTSAADATSGAAVARLNHCQAEMKTLMATCFDAMLSGIDEVLDDPDMAATGDDLCDAISKAFEVLAINILHATEDFSGIEEAFTRQKLADLKDMYENRLENLRKATAIGLQNQKMEMMATAEKQIQKSKKRK